MLCVRVCARVVGTVLNHCGRREEEEEKHAGVEQQKGGDTETWPRRSSGVYKDKLLHIYRHHILAHIYCIFLTFLFEITLLYWTINEVLEKVTLYIRYIAYINK